MTGTLTRIAPAANAPAQPAKSGRKFNYQDYALVAVIAILIIVGGILEGSSFVSKDNFFNVLRQGSVVGVLAIGMTFVIATAGIDLSVGSMVAATAIAGGWLMEHVGLLDSNPTLWFVLGSLNAMRVGLLTRFWGILGVIIGPGFVFGFAPPVMVFWLIAIGVLFLGRWPRGLICGKRSTTTWSTARRPSWIGIAGRACGPSWKR